MREGQPEIIVMDASVLMNFLCIDRMDLIAVYSHGIVDMDHVSDEISDQYNDQKRRISMAIDAGVFRKRASPPPRRYLSSDHCRRLAAWGPENVPPSPWLCIGGMHWQSMTGKPRRRQGVSIQNSVFLQRRTSWSP